MNLKKKILSSLRVDLNQQFKSIRTGILLFLLFFSSFIYSQNSQLQNFSTKEGLPQSQVYDIVQDSIGYLWLATQGGGLARFDGDEFTVFNEKKNLKSNFVNTLLVKSDSLFIGTSSGLSIYAKGKFTNYESSKINKVVYLDNRVYLATDQGIYEYEKGGLRLIKSAAKIDLSIVTDISKDGRNYLVATKTGIWSLNQIENPTSATKLDASDYSSLIRVNGITFASTLDTGFKLIRNSKILKSYEESLIINQISFIDQHYWLATGLGGIIKLDINLNRVQTINQNNSILVNQIHTIVKDMQENIWIGSSGGGLYKLTQNNFQHFDRNSGLKGNRIYAVHSIDDEIWITNSEKGVLKIDSLGVAPIDADNGYLNLKSKAISSDYSDNIWVGTEGRGILIFKKKYIIDSIQDTSKFNSLDKKLFSDYTWVTDTIDRTNGLTSNYIKKVEFGNGSAWVATYSSGIVELKFNAKTLQLSNRKTIYDTKKGLKDLKINDIAIEDGRLGKVWYATKNGNLGHISNGNVRDYYQILEKKISITTILIKGNEIYLGTLGDGIWIANLQNPREIKKLSGVKNLNSNNIYQLIFDNENNLWAGTEKGVNKIVLDENNSISNVFYFDRSDGFLGIETCQNAVTKDSDGNIWFGTMNGLTKYVPSKSQLKKAVPTISFESIEVTYQTLDSLNFNDYSKTLLLKPTENHLSFQYKSVDINHPKGIEYRWKLTHDKLDSEYSPWNSRDFIDFPNLDNGDYHFTVQARNIDWIESTPISFSFFIDKPLFEKSWFLSSVYGGLGLVILLLAIYYGKKRRKKNIQKIEKLKLDNHLLSLEQKALQLQMNPHFIFNVLNGIKAMGSEGETQEMNSTINTFASLLRSILNSSRQEEISLQEEVKTLQNYLTLEQQMNVNSFEYTIDVETNYIDSEEILIPPMLIQPFVENSIKHGFKNLKHAGEIVIRFYVRKEFLHCEVKDNGIGINQSKQETQSHQSMALQVTKERIESLSGANSLHIKEDNGTIVSFHLPLKTDF